MGKTKVSTARSGDICSMVGIEGFDIGDTLADLENSLFTKYHDSGPMHISVEVQKEPIVGGFGFGARATLMGYFIRGDISWGVDDYRVRKPIYYLSLSLDF